MFQSRSTASRSELGHSRFEDMWLDMMVEHHHGAIEMAKDLQEDGRFSPAVDLADDIAAGQTAEVDQMTDLLER